MVGANLPEAVTNPSLSYGINSVMPSKFHRLSTVIGNRLSEPEKCGETFPEDRWYRGSTSFALIETEQWSCQGVYFL